VGTWFGGALAMLCGWFAGKGCDASSTIRLPEAGHCTDERRELPAFCTWARWLPGALPIWRWTRCGRHSDHSQLLHALCPLQMGSAVCGEACGWWHAFVAVTPHSRHPLHHRLKFKFPTWPPWRQSWAASRVRNSLPRTFQTRRDGS